jgi:anti-sigma B factor antagonist
MPENPPETGVATSMVGDTLVITPPAEVDHGNSTELLEALAEALAAHRTVVVDMTGNVFCDSSGLRALLVAQRSRPDSELRMAVDGTHVRRIFKMTGTHRLLRLFDTVADAVAAEPGMSPGEVI